MTHKPGPKRNGQRPESDTGAETAGAHIIDPHAHPRCVVCGANNSHGLQLQFVECEDGTVESRFDCRPGYEGYPNQLHGGVIAMLLDGAMTNCLFANGYTAVTAELCVRYGHPVATARSSVVRARVERSHSRLHFVVAELEQDGQVKATATAKFLARRETNDTVEAGD